VKRIAAALLIIVVLLLAACGSGGTHPSGATPLTPTAYRAKANALCVQAKHELGKTSASSASSRAGAIALLQRALGIFQPILTSLQGTTPPSSLATGHAQLVASLKTLVDGGQALITKLNAGTPPKAVFAPASIKSLLQAVAGMKTGFTTLGLATCTKLISGK